MSEKKLLTQAQAYTQIIIIQIKANFCELARQVDNCQELKTAIDNYNKSVEQSKVSEFFLKLNPEEYRTKLDETEQKTNGYICDGYHTVEPLTVGLFGEWGSGKTHQLKLIKKQLLHPVKAEENDKNRCEKNNGVEIKTPAVIPVFFNAWRFEKEEHIIIPLFQTLLQAVESYERSLGEKAGKTGRTLSLYVKAGLLSLHKGFKFSADLKSLKNDVIAGGFGKALNQVFDAEKVKESVEKKVNNERIGEQALKELIASDVLESIYLNIPQWIEKITLFEKVNFVFLIDDLDRCLPENTLKMLESIKLFLDVPSCAFVLAIDDDVVERGVVHHYRDYLKIYHTLNNDKEEANTSLAHELPITGHEYLEKMIQLPLRLPVIDAENVRSFMKEHSQKGWMELVDRDFDRKVKEWRDKLSEDQKDTLGEPRKPSEVLLDFFKDKIPPKPRKIKRTAMLFESKIRLLDALDLREKINYELIAKLTLLELFAPKLLRYIQNNGYARVYNALCRFRDAVEALEVIEFPEAKADGAKQEEKESREESDEPKPQNSLTDVQKILSYIKKNPDYTQKERDIFTRLMVLVREHYSSRILFDLDDIFDESQESEKLKIIIEARESISVEPLEAKRIYFDEDFYKQLFREDAPDVWKGVLKEHGARLDSAQLREIFQKAEEIRDTKFNNLPFIANPQWVGEVAGYVSDEDYIKFLEASHNTRFKKFNFDDKKLEIDSFTVTFAEYDKYCEHVAIEMPSDNGWGRGRRPVINIYWEDAVRYTKWLSRITGCTYRLPTEAEWDYCCRAETTTKWSFGDDESELEKYAWYDENSDGKTHPVGKKEKNPWELYDMHGNVWEWCEDWYDENKKTKVLRGGSWVDHATRTRSAERFRSGPTYHLSFVGFRLIRTLPL